MPYDTLPDPSKVTLEDAPKLKIPWLPAGNSIPEYKSNYKTPHSFVYKNGYVIDKTRLNGLENTTPEELLKSLQIDPDLTYGSKRYHAKATAPRFVPAYVALDKMVLRFDGYFKETVHESTEQYHLRKVRILYFLEDDSIAVVEPPVENSGMPQNSFIKRQRLPKEPANDQDNQTFYSARDFNVGINVTFYGRTFRIVSCDPFTKKYMEETEKIKINPFETVPVDPYLESRTKPRRDYTVPSICPTPKHNDKLQRFLDYDRHVLRFYCIWDDRGSMFGELREFVLHYYLVDDTVEVREVSKPNNGRDPCPILLRKQPLPKTLGGSDYYTWKDLMLGSVVNILGRPMLMQVEFIILMSSRDCDESTRAYLCNQLNLSETQVQPVHVELDANHALAQPETPPYNGYGTIEDSLGSCKHLVLQPPKKDFIKMLENEHKVLRFVAKMESKHKEDAERRFVISYRLADDMMTIYEPPQRNAGVLGGKFLERTRVLKPNSVSTLSSVSPLGLAKEPEYYNAPDLFVGGQLEIFRHKFVLLDADDYVFNHMESLPTQFPFSDKNKVVQEAKQRLAKGPCTLSQLEEALRKQDRDQVGFLDRVAVVQVLSQCLDLNRHQSITLSRTAEQGPYHKVEYKKLVASLA